MAGVLAAGSVATAGTPWETDDGGWSTRVRPLFEENCTKCHGGVKKKAGLDLRSIDHILRGSENGAVVEPGKPEASPLLEVLLPGADPHMPPKGEPLDETEIGLVEAWIRNLDDRSAAAGGAGGARGWLRNVEPDVPAGTAPADAVDRLLAAAWDREGVVPGSPADDRTFARRAWLDLAGRIPTPDELASFLEDGNPGKRSRLVDRLLEAPETARHLAGIFDVVLLGRPEDGRHREDREEWWAYLERVFATNRPWDRVAADLLAGRRPGDAPDGPPGKGAAWFLYSHRNDHQAIAERVAPVLFGQQIACAQCHDHPLVPEIEQRHYWGLVSFFSRSFNVRTPDGPAVAERAAGGYADFSTLSGDSRPAELVFLDDRTAVEPGGRIERDADAADRYRVPPPEELLKPADDPKKEEERRKNAPEVPAVPVPGFSRRESLVELGVRGNPGFAEAFVNRIWAHLFGRGLVHPVDQLDSTRPPSHPDVLVWLGRDFADHGFDVHRLVRTLTATRAYGLDSTPAGGAPVPPPDSFAIARPKPLSGEQWARSLLVACGHRPDERGEFPDVDEDRVLRAFVAYFPDLFPEVATSTPSQAMFLTNNPLFDDLLPIEGEGLVSRLASTDSSEAAARAAFVEILGREPDLEELARAAAFLAVRPDRRTSAVRQLCWALVTGAEFRFRP